MAGVSSRHPGGSIMFFFYLGCLEIEIEIGMLENLLNLLHSR